MREIQSVRLLKEDFIVMRGDTIVSIDVPSVLKNFEEHLARSKATIQLKLFSKSNPLDKRKSDSNNTFIFTDENKVIRFYENIGSKKKFLIKGKFPNLEFQFLSIFASLTPI